MRSLLAVLTFLSFAIALPVDSSASCKGGEHAQNLRVAGSVYFSVSGQNCLMNGDEKVCFENHETFRDHCTDKSTVAKFFCEDDRPSQRVAKCPQGTVCDKGACQ
jgi:hypothetical protein